MAAFTAHPAYTSYSSAPERQQRTMPVPGVAMYTVIWSDESAKVVALLAPVMLRRSFQLVAGAACVGSFGSGA